MKSIKRSLVSVFFFSLLGAVLFGSLLSAQLKEVRKEAPYVPSQLEVVDVLLNLAEVEENDLLFDLGCGDGRIVIAAAERYGTKGVGVDIAPELIELSIKNARLAGVADRLLDIAEGPARADQAWVVAGLGGRAGCGLRRHLAEPRRGEQSGRAAPAALGAWL